MMANKRAVLVASGDADDEEGMEEEDRWDETTSRYIDQLPDPDLVGRRVSDSDSEADDPGSEETVPASKPSKKGQKKRRRLASSSSSDETADPEENEWQLPDQESLALRLLGS